MQMYINGYIEEKSVNERLVFDSKDKNRQLIKSKMMFLMELKIKS